MVPLILALLRDDFHDKRTLGRLSIEGGGRHLCFTCEDPDRGLDEGWTLEDLAAAKVAGETAIASGLHRVTLESSPKYGADTLTIHVIGHRAIRIHVGNDENDTEGCVLPGTTRSSEGVWESRKALAALHELLVTYIKSGGSVWIRISRDSKAWAEAPHNPARAAA